MSNSIPSKMRAAVIKDFRKGYEVKDIDVPTHLGPNDILVKIQAAGYCHTDLQVSEGIYESQGGKPGLVGSHEPAGIVVKAGDKAGESGIKVGDRVGSINTYGFCGGCNSCKVGKQLCDKMPGMLGLSLPGGFSEFMKADARVVSKIPESIPWAEAAPLFCAGSTTFGALCAIKPKEGLWIGIIGIGGLGHLAVQYAKALKMKVIAIDNRQEGLDLCNELPSHLRPDKTYVINSDKAKDKIAEELSSGFYETNPGVDRVLINAEEPSLVQWAQQILRKGGYLCDVGLPAGSSFQVDPFALNFKEQSIVGSLISTPEQAQEMVKLHADNGCKTFIEKTYTVDQANEMAEHYTSKKLMGRLCMVFDEAKK